MELSMARVCGLIELYLKTETPQRRRPLGEFLRQKNFYYSGYPPESLAGTLLHLLDLPQSDNSVGRWGEGDTSTTNINHYKDFFILVKSQFSFP